MKIQIKIGIMCHIKRNNLIEDSDNLEFIVWLEKISAFLKVQRCLMQRGNLSFCPAELHVP